MNRGRHKKNKVDKIAENNSFINLQKTYSDYKLYYCEICFYKLYAITTRLKFNVCNGEEFFKIIKRGASKNCDQIYISFKISIFEEKYKRINSTIYIK